MSLLLRKWVGETLALTPPSRAEANPVIFSRIAMAGEGPALSPRRGGKHAQFLEISCPLVWYCVMGTYVGCYDCTNALSAVPSERPDVEGTRPRRLFSELVHKPRRVAWRGPSSTYGHRANLVWLEVRGRLEPRCRTESKPHPYRSANGENVQSRRQNCDSSTPSLQPSRSLGGPAPLRRPIAGG